MRIFSISPAGVTETEALPRSRRRSGYVWIACTRTEFEALQAEIQATLAALSGTTLVDLHVSDLLNAQLTSHYEATSQYDLLVFRRLATGQGDGHVAPRRASPRGPAQTQRPAGAAPHRHHAGGLRRVRPGAADGASGRLHRARRLCRRACWRRSPAAEGARGPCPANARLPASPADLMLRMVNQIVDGYLALRRELSRQLDHWQAELLDPRTRFSNWGALLEARLTLHQLDDICEDQRAAVLDWIEALKGWPVADDAEARHEHELLMVRSRDVLEHIERVVRHVTRLEHNAETAVQMHFSAQGNRTNNIMRTLTALTAIFLPLNLITGFFGMNFETFPFIHSVNGLWWTLGAMVCIAATMGLLFWRKRYLARTGR